MTGEMRPLIVTAAFDEDAFAWFEDLRRSHFPPALNRVPAHLTLFHALPGAHQLEITEVLETACRRRAPMSLRVRGPWSLGRGVAYRIAAPELEALHAELAEEFEPWLTRQDRAGFRPHVTVQNKASPEEARALLERLQHDFEPFEVSAVGLLVWTYLGGPWELLMRLPFKAAAAAR